MYTECFITILKTIREKSDSLAYAIFLTRTPKTLRKI